MILQWIVFFWFFALLWFISSWQKDVCHDFMDRMAKIGLTQTQLRDMAGWCGWKLDAMENILRGSLVVVFIYLLGRMVFGR